MKQEDWEVIRFFSIIIVSILFSIIIFRTLWNIHSEQEKLQRDLCERNNMTYTSRGALYTGRCNKLEGDTTTSYRIKRINKEYYYRLDEVIIKDVGEKQNA